MHVPLGFAQSGRNHAEIGRKTTTKPRQSGRNHAQLRNPSTETTDEFGEEDDGPLGLIVWTKVTTTEEGFAEIGLCFKLRYDV